jgi:acetyl esterase/lipase
MKTIKICINLMLLFTINTRAQKVINLYSSEIPNSKTSGIKESYANEMFREVTNPTLEIYLPEKGKATGAAVIICLGGGYAVVVYQGEGIITAKEFAKHGTAAFVLKYRPSNDLTMIDKKNGTLQYTQQAIKLVRENAEEGGSNAEKIGIMGFSAGGYLASTLATHFEKALVGNKKIQA